MILPARTREHVLTGLSATPRILALLAGPLAPNSPVWELSLPHRFTLKETMAHLADWDKVFLKRAQATLKGGAALDDPDSGVVASQRKYGLGDPHESIQLFGFGRQKLTRFFKGLSEADWDKAAVHPRHGSMSLEVQAVHVLGHDGYHLDAISTMLAIAGLAEAGIREPNSDYAM